MNTEESVKLLARVDERTKLMQDRLDDFIQQSQKNCQRCFEDHEKRIRSLERWQWKATGIATAISAFLGSIVGILVERGGS